MLEPAVWAQNNFGSDYAVRPNDCSRTDFGGWIDNRRRVDLCVAHLQPLTSILSPYVRGEAENNCTVAGRSRVPHTPGRLALCKGEGEGEGSLRSFIEEREHQLAFGDDCVVHYAVALRFRHAIAARSR